MPRDVIIILCLLVGFIVSLELAESVPQASTEITLVRTVEYDCSFAQIISEYQKSGHKCEYVSTCMALLEIDNSGVTHREYLYLNITSKQTSTTGSADVEQRFYDIKSTEDLVHLHNACLQIIQRKKDGQFIGRSASVAPWSDSETTKMITASIKTEIKKHQLLLDQVDSQIKKEFSKFPSIISRYFLYLQQMLRYVYPSQCYLTMIGEYLKDDFELYQSYWVISKFPITVESLSDSSCDPESKNPLYLLVGSPPNILLSGDPYLAYNKLTISGMCDAINEGNSFLLYAHYGAKLYEKDWCYFTRSNARTENLIVQPLKFYSIGEY